MLEKVYEECNENLRESDRKRDQIMVFYTLIVGAFLSSIDSLQRIYLFEPLIIAIAILGLFLSITIIHYRKWHMIYVNTIEFIQMYNNSAFTKNYIEEQKQRVLANIGIKVSSSFLNWFFKEYHAGVEFLTFNGFLIISYIPVYAIIISLFEHCKLSSCIYIMIFLIGLIIFLIHLNLIAAWIIYHDLKSFPWVRFMIQGLGKGSNKIDLYPPKEPTK